MSFAYELMYRLGFTPWERAGEQGSEQLQRWLASESPHGRALDVGCGTGRHTIELAQRGWEAVGIDNVQHAVDRARRRPGTGNVTFIVGDVTRLAEHVQGPFSLFLDIGCFHGLNPTQRAAVGAGITELAAADATLLMMAFSPNHVPVLPHGASPAEIEEAFPTWRIDHMEQASTERMPKPIQAMRPRIYRLVRS